MSKYGFLCIYPNYNTMNFCICGFMSHGFIKNVNQYIFFSTYFNWRLITLQHCGGFCHTFTWVNHGCTCVPHPEPPSHLPLLHDRCRWLFQMVPIQRFICCFRFLYQYLFWQSYSSIVYPPWNPSIQVCKTMTF